MGGRQDGNGGSMLEIIDVAAVLARGAGCAGHDWNNERKLREETEGWGEKRESGWEGLYISNSGSTYLSVL
jgi:hypothetical protein